MIRTFIHSGESIFKGVKQESSHVAVRRKDEQGTPTFEELVFDEEYMILFRELFFDARANITSACSAYLKTVTDDGVFDSQNFDTEQNFALQLTLPNTFVASMSDSVSIKMKAYLIAYIMYRWMETKLPNEAGTYLMRAETHLQDMKRFLEMRTGRRIKGSIF